VAQLVRSAFLPNAAALVVIVLRADFYAHCGRFDALRQALAQHQEYIGPMTGTELQRAIEEPARRGNWEFEPGLVDLLLHDVGAGAGLTPEPGALPLLSHALLATWQRRRGRTLTLSGYAASGGVRGAIAETAEDVFYDRLSPEQRRVARQIFVRLTELGGETAAADTRRRVHFRSWPQSRAAGNGQRRAADPGGPRLITTDQDTAEVAHEALIREWPTLRGWLEEDREGLRLHRRLTLAAQEWELLRRDPGILLRGARLAQALEWAEMHPEELNVLEGAFLGASSAALEKESVEREARRQRELETARRLAENERERAKEQQLAAQRLRRRAVFLAVALLATVLMAATVLLFWRSAVRANRLAGSRELAAAALNQLQVDPERSALLAMHALDAADTLEARNALHQAVPELHLLASLAAHPGGVPDVAYSPDGTRLASIGADGMVKIWEPGTGELLLTLDGGLAEPGYSLAFSPDGGLLAAGYVTHVLLWDPSSGEMIAGLSGQSVGTEIGYNLSVGQMCFSPDGSRLAVANMDGHSKVWEPAAAREILAFGAAGLPAKAMACSPDGKVLATAGDEGIVRLWDAESGEEIFALPLGGIIHSIAFDPQGIRLGTASEDGSVKLWDPASGREILSLPRISGLYDLAFLPDGSFATAGQDGTARVWDSATGLQQILLAGASSTVISVAGSPDGSRIATGAYDGSLRIWDAAPGKATDDQAHQGSSGTSLTARMAAGSPQPAWMGQ
jgi:WD40 repeat protein